MRRKALYLFIMQIISTGCAGLCFGRSLFDFIVADVKEVLIFLSLCLALIALDKTQDLEIKLCKQNIKSKLICKCDETVEILDDVKEQLKKDNALLPSPFGFVRAKDRPRGTKPI